MINESIAKLVKYGENAGLVSGLDKIYATNRILEIMQISDYEEPEQIPETDSTTIGGWVMELLGHIPEKGETAVCGTFHFKVLEADNQTVKLIRLEIVPEKEADGDAKEN